MRLLLVRHGESTWNVEGRYQGRLDAPLSSRGRAQAEALASRLTAEQLVNPSEKRLAAIVSSPLARARDTAQTCARTLGLTVGVDERLTEISHGEWEGKLRGEIAARWPDVLTAWQSTPHRVRFPNGESLDDVHHRLVSFLKSLGDGSQPLLVVTHDVIVRLAVLAAWRKPLSAFNEVSVDNAALNEFSWECSSGRCGPPAKLKAVRLNDTAHLGVLRSDTLSQAL